MSATPVLPWLRARRGRLALLLSLPVLLAITLLPSGAASAAAVPVAQCNGILNQGGQTVRCSVTVANTLNASTGVGSSTVTTQQCTGAIGAPTCAAPVTSSFQDVVTSVSQCNGSASGGGGEVACTVDVTNTITSGATATAATVNQCIGSADGSGTAICSPLGSTSGATVTQCNGSGNGGGSTVTCTVAPASTRSTSLLVTVGQCNGSANGGGSLVTCRSSITNNIIGAGATPTPTATASASATASPSSSPTATPTSTTSPAPTVRPTRGATSSATPAGVTPPARVGPAGAPGAAGPGTSTTGVTAPRVGGPTTGAPPTRTSLPRTGSETGLLALLGSLSIAMGLGLLLAARRPQARHALR